MGNPDYEITEDDWASLIAMAEEFGARDEQELVHI
jgi:hypothetical protein